MISDHADDLLLKRIRDLAELSDRRGIMACSDFLTLYEQNLAGSLEGTLRTVHMLMDGGYPDAERRIAVFYPVDMEKPEDFPIACIRIRPKSVRFAEKMTHRDYLGALIHLGIERSVIGDILAEEDEAFVFCLRRMASFILDHLEKVRHNVVETSLIEDIGELPSPRLMDVKGSVASVRLDALTGLAFHESRSVTAKLIEGGQVFADGRQITRSSFEPKEGMRISVRGYGRFIYAGMNGSTKKGRVNVTLRKYV